MRMDGQRMDPTVSASHDQKVKREISREPL